MPLCTADAPSAAGFQQDQGANFAVHIFGLLIPARSFIDRLPEKQRAIAMGHYRADSDGDGDLE